MAFCAGDTQRGPVVAGHVESLQACVDAMQVMYLGISPDVAEIGKTVIRTPCDGQRFAANQVMAFPCFLGFG